MLDSPERIPSGRGAIGDEREGLSDVTILETKQAHSKIDMFGAEP